REDSSLATEYRALEHRPKVPPAVFAPSGSLRNSSSGLDIRLRQSSSTLIFRRFRGRKRSPRTSRHNPELDQFRITRLGVLREVALWYSLIFLCVPRVLCGSSA